MVEEAESEYEEAYNEWEAEYDESLERDAEAAK